MSTERPGSGTGLGTSPTLFCKYTGVSTVQSLFALSFIRLFPLKGLLCPLEASIHVQISPTKSNSEQCLRILRTNIREFLPAIYTSTTANINRTRAWLVIFGAFTCLFCTVGFLNSFGVFEDYYATAQLAHESQSTIGWLGAMAIFFLFSISTIAGAILDIFGPKVGKSVCLFAFNLSTDDYSS